VSRYPEFTLTNGADQLAIQAMTAGTGPTNYFGGHTDCKRIVGEVLSYDRACTDKRASTYVYSANDRHVRTYRGAIADPRPK